MIQYGGAEFPWPLLQSSSPLMLSFSSGGVEEGGMGGPGFLVNVTYITRSELVGQEGRGDQGGAYLFAMKIFKMFIILFSHSNRRSVIL